MWGRTRTLIERVQLDQQAVQFPQAVITAQYLKLKGSPHVKVVTQFSPIQLRCAINSSGCLVLKKQKQIAPYKISYSYPQQQAIPTSTLDQLRKRAQAEGWYYAGCPINPPGPQVFVESGTCKGNYWGLIYLANASKLSSDVFSVTKGRRLIRGVVAIDWTGGMNLGGSKDTLLQYDPFVLQGLYLYQGSTIVRPSFREIQTTTP